MINYRITIIILILLVKILLVSATETNHNEKIVVIGSSMAAGWVTSYQEQYDMQNGYAARLGRLLSDRGYELINVSVPGDNTANVIQRFDKDVLPLNPKYLIIGLSLSNEGLETENPDKVTESFENGIKKIIEKCESNNIYPILGSCYSNNNYNEEQYKYIKKMNIKMNEFDVPVINLLGGLDNGLGNFPNIHLYDADHPGNRGHEEMFYGIIPDLFDAITQEKQMPKFIQDSKFIKVKNDGKYAPISYIPNDVIHSFTISFNFKNKKNGEIIFIRNGRDNSSMKIEDSVLIYRSSDGKTYTSVSKISENAWNSITLVHNHIQNRTQIVLNNSQLINAEETIIPRQIVIGGLTKPGINLVKDLLIYRSALNMDEINEINNNDLLNASLEVYCPLNEKTSKNNELANHALSLSKVFYYLENSSDLLNKIEKKIQKTENDRKKSKSFPDKQPISLDPSIYHKYQGEYEIAPGDIMKIEVENQKIFLIDRGQKSELFPESKTTFFVKYPVLQIKVIFEFKENPQLRLNINGEDALIARKLP